MGTLCVYLWSYITGPRNAFFFRDNTTTILVDLVCFPFGVTQYKALQPLIQLYCNKPRVAHFPTHIFVRQAAALQQYFFFVLAILEVDSIKIFILSFQLTVLVKVEMVISVLSYTFTPELQNKSSPVYKETERNFTAEVSMSFLQLRGCRVMIFIMMMIITCSDADDDQ